MLKKKAVRTGKQLNEPDPAAGEEKAMEERTVRIAGRKTCKIIGHFPPARSDPFLRVVFPREAAVQQPNVLFRLHLPGFAFPPIGKRSSG